MTTLPVSASRIHARAIRGAFCSGNFSGAENQFLALRHSLPQFAYSEAYPRVGAKKADHLPSVRLPAHTYIHGVLRHGQPPEYALREVGWMLSWGFRVRRKTMDAVLKVVERKALVEGRKKAEAEGKEGGIQASDDKDEATKRFGKSVQHLQEKDQDLATALRALRLVRMHGYKGATHVSVEMYKVLVEACIARDEYVTAALAFEMMIEDWVRSLSPPTPSANAPSATTSSANAPSSNAPSANAPPATTSSATTPSATSVPLSFSNDAPRGNANQTDSAFLTPVQFADLSHGTFNALCGTLKRRLWSSQPVPNRTPEETKEARRYQSIIINSIAILVSLLDRRLLPYYNIRKLLEVMFMCTRTTPHKVYIVKGLKGKRVDMRLFLKRVAASLVHDLGSHDLSPIPEISQMLRWRDTLLPHFNLDTYRALLDLVYHAFRSAKMGAKLINIMAEDGEKMRISLNKEVCVGLVAWPTRLRFMGLDTAVYNYLWNTSGLEAQLAKLFVEKEEQSEMDRQEPQRRNADI